MSTPYFAVVYLRYAASTIFHELFHLLGIRFALRTTNLLHHGQLFLAEVLLPAFLHEPFHLVEIRFAVVAATFSHHFVPHQVVLLDRRLLGITPLCLEQFGETLTDQSVAYCARCDVGLRFEARYTSELRST